jgi:hypothetical protein
MTNSKQSERKEIEIPTLSKSEIKILKKIEYFEDRGRSWGEIMKELYPYQRIKLMIINEKIKKIKELTT